MTNNQKAETKIAYFSMEIALLNDIKSYAGGLGVLAGDTLKAAADLKMPMLGVTLLNNKGYFKQVIDKNGEQIEEVEEYDYSKLKRLDIETFVDIGKDRVKICAWEYKIKSNSGYVVPVYFLDTDIEENKEEYRQLTGVLYGGDKEYRLKQEIILGRGGVRLLAELGYSNISKYHLNEGHAALVAVEILSDYRSNNDTEDIKDIIEKIREMCIFTTHTPVKAGHDIFSVDLLKNLQSDFPFNIPELIVDNNLNMSLLALYFSSYVNGVALSHQKVSTEMFPGHNIAAITNGVHSQTWTSLEFRDLYDMYIPNWRNCNLSLRNVFNIPPNEIWKAHMRNKKKLLNYIKQKKNIKLSEDVFTIGFARRFTGYKRSTLLFYNMNELLRIHKRVGKMQIVYAGKAHPNDYGGKAMIREVHDIIRHYKEDIDIVFLDDYDMNLASIMIPGVDIWLNTPLPPNEASGTSGMKAAHNGVPQFSTMDGWWVEGFVDGKTGWSIGEKHNGIEPEKLIGKDAADLYYKLENYILPRYYNKPNLWCETMCYSISINASFFNAERMLRQYAQEAYL